MRIPFPMLMVCTVLLGNCASVDTSSTMARLDMSATRPLEGSYKLMTAEVVYIRDLLHQSDTYRYEAINRRHLDIDNYVQTLSPGYYQIIAICTEKSMHPRLAGLISIDKRTNGNVWGRFQTSTGTVLLPAIEMNLDLNGQETIVPVNMSLHTDRMCDAVYGEGEVNQPPMNMSSPDEYISEYGEKVMLYSYW